jgi:hypothetical protein
MLIVPVDKYNFFGTVSPGRCRATNWLRRLPKKPGGHHQALLHKGCREPRRIPSHRVRAAYIERYFQ